MKLIAIQKIVPEYNEEDKQRLLHCCRHDLIEKLMDAVHNERWYSIRIRESWSPDATMSKEDQRRLYPLYYYDEEVGIYHMEVEFNEIEVRQYWRPEPIPLEDLGNAELTKTAIQELKQRIIKKVEDLFNG